VNSSTGESRIAFIQGINYTINWRSNGQGIACGCRSGQTTTLAVTDTAIRGYPENAIDKLVDGNGQQIKAGTIIP
jgi:hypothetical protein